MSIPILRAVPSIIRIAVSTLEALRSFIFASAISRTLSRDPFATFFLLGSPEPDSIPAAFLSRIGAGGVLVINVKDLSSNTVISTGIISPA